MNQYCPNCIVKLTRQSKKLGNLSVWYVCPQCGFRTRPKSIHIEYLEYNSFINYKNYINSNNNQFKEYKQ